MNTVEVGRYLIAVIKAVVCKLPIPRKPEGVDWAELYEVALRHKVANILAYAAEQLSGLPAEIRDKLEKELCLVVMQETKRDYAVRQLFSVFEEQGILYMPLKGYIMKTLYPSPDMRTMSDVDILIHSADAERAKEIMLKNGYQVRFSNREEDAYLKAPMVSIELHKQLIGEEEKLYNDYYGDGWRVAKQQNGGCFSMTDEDYYIYHIVHLAKHYKTSGTGIRSILDIYIFLRQKSESLDWDYIVAELTGLKLNTFAQNLRKLAYAWFEDGNRDTAVLQMEEFIYFSGVYGNAWIYCAARGMQKKQNRYFQKIFPNLKVMTGVYPVLIKVPFLLPFFWIHRGITRVLFRRDRIKTVLVTESTATDTASEQIKQHFMCVGIE